MDLWGIDIKKALLGMHYPARRSDLLVFVHGQGVTDDLIDALFALPDQQYRSAHDVAQAVLRRQRSDRRAAADQPDTPGNAKGDEHDPDAGEVADA